MITIKNLEEMQPYYNEETNTYIFNDDVKFNINISVNSNIQARDITAMDIDTDNITAMDITAWDINAWNITAMDIDARDIDANNIIADNITAMDIDARDIIAKNINASNITSRNINANNISYYAVCIAYNDIVCNSIQGRRENSKHFALDGEIIIKGEFE